ncbi:MAG: hypothetical protein ABFS16_09425 [Bacteroidota bacterium]
MKKLLSVTVLLLVSTLLFAQSDKEEMEYYQSLFGMGKKAMVAEFVELNENDAFWSLYEEYEDVRKKLGQERITILKEYAGNYVNYSDDRMDILVKKSQDMNKKLAKLIDSYYKKIKKQSGSIKAAQFYQIENFFLAAIRAEVLGDLPVIKK